MALHSGKMLHKGNGLQINVFNLAALRAINMALRGL